MKRFLTAGTLASIAFAAAACAPSTLHPRLDALSEAMHGVSTEQAIECAPREWALVETHSRFAADDWRDRRYKAAERHAAEAESALAAVKKHITECGS